MKGSTHETQENICGSNFDLRLYTMVVPACQSPEDLPAPQAGPDGGGEVILEAIEILPTPTPPSEAWPGFFGSRIGGRDREKCGDYVGEALMQTPKENWRSNCFANSEGLHYEATVNTTRLVADYGRTYDELRLQLDETHESNGDGTQTVTGATLRYFRNGRQVATASAVPAPLTQAT